MKLFLLIFMLVCKQTKSLQDSTKSDGASFYSFKIDRLNNDVNIVGIDSSIYSCATQCLSGCSRCESECESSCNKNKNETAQSQDFEKSSSILSKSKVFKFFFNFQKFNELFNHSRKYWRKDQHLLIEIDDISDKCSSTKVAACTTGCQSICSVCEYECGLSCIPDEETNSEIVNLVKNQVVSKLDKSQVSIVCNDTCNAMCSYCKCDCLSYCQDHQSILTTKTCDEFCGTQCKNLCSSPSGLSECGNNCLSKVSSHATNDHDMNDGTWSETWGIHEDGTVTWTSEQLGNDPEVEFSCEEKCGTTCVSQCESSCALGNPFNNDGSGLNKNGIITPASWYSLRLKIFELFMNRKSGVSSVLRTSFEDFKPNDNCGLVKESACRPTCETICSFCQTQCKVYQDYSNSISEQIENHGGWNGSVVLQNYQELVDSMYSELNGICDDVCGNMCSTCQCLCESECAKNLAELALANKTQNIDIESRCATTCEDSCGTCDFDCNSACNALDQRTNDTLGTDESSQVSPPVRTKLSFDMHTRIAGEGLSVTIYFIVVEDGMRMYCDTTALPGTTAANIWSQKMASTLDNENNDVNDIHDYDHHDSDNTTIHQDVDIITNDGNFGVEHDEDITNQFEGARKSQIRAGACHESMPNIYVLKDKSCCGFPSLPQCKAVNARKLGCVDKLGTIEHTYAELSYHDLENACLAITDKPATFVPKSDRTPQYIPVNQSSFRLDLVSPYTFNFNHVKFLSSGTKAIEIDIDSSLVSIHYPAASTSSSSCANNGEEYEPGLFDNFPHFRLDGLTKEYVDIISFLLVSAYVIMFLLSMLNLWPSTGRILGLYSNPFRTFDERLNQIENNVWASFKKYRRIYH